MPKTTSTRESALLGAAGWGGFSRDEVVAAVCKYFCRGHTAADIKRILKEKLGITLTREQPYRLLSYAGRRGWLSFHAPMNFELADQIHDRYQWLHKIAVVRTAVSDDIAYHVARTLLEFSRAFRREHSPETDLHVGFAGGNSLRKAARHFAEMLREPQQGLPKRIVFHAMVAGFHYEDVAADPNAFFLYLRGEPALQVKTSFVALHVPGLVKTAKMDELRALDHIREAYAAVKEIHIIVTSAGGHWQEGHSALYNMYRADSPKSLALLNQAGCVGDMMWRPLGPKGPLELRTEIRTMTLMELSELPPFIKRGGRVLLLLGPCGSCAGPKSDVLKAILHSEKALVTDVVVDSRSAAGLLGQ